MAGGISGAMKESVQRAFSYVQAKKTELGIAHDLGTSDMHVEVIDLLGDRVEAEVGVAFFVASYSALRKAPVGPALLVLGDMSVQGNIKPLRSLTEPLQVAKDNGAKRALIPIENKPESLDWHQRLAYSAWRFSIAMHRSTGVRVHLIISCPMPFEGAAVAMERGIR